MARGARAGAAVELDNVGFTYSDGDVVEALCSISLNLAPGQSCAVIGPSGCGKSTLLHVLAGLRKPTSGAVRINGQRLDGPRRDTAFILQDYGLLPWKSLQDNVVLGLQIRGVSSAAAHKKAASWLKKLGLWSVRRLLPAQLSGGQRQRTAVARSLVLEPDLLLMDEPFSSLDALTREELQDELLEVASYAESTLVVVTHSIEEAVLLGRRVVVLSRRPGSVLANVDNTGWGTPGYRQTREFFNRCAELRRILADKGCEVNSA